MHFLAHRRHRLPPLLPQPQSVIVLKDETLGEGALNEEFIMCFRASERASRVRFCTVQCRHGKQNDKNRVRQGRFAAGSGPLRLTRALVVFGREREKGKNKREREMGKDLASV